MERIRKWRELSCLLRGAARFSSRHIRLFAAAGERARLAVIVPRKVGKASARNRIRRVIRECFRTEAKNLGKGDHLFLARPGAGELGNEEIRSEVRGIIQKLG